MTKPDKCPYCGHKKIIEKLGSWVCDSCIKCWPKHSFATENLQKYHDPKKGDCKTCDEKDIHICEHGNCMACGCRGYCWLD